VVKRIIVGLFLDVDSGLRVRSDKYGKKWRGSGCSCILGGTEEETM
jgi:hypothetical protein